MCSMNIPNSYFETGLLVCCTSMLAAIGCGADSLVLWPLIAMLPRHKSVPPKHASGRIFTLICPPHTPTVQPRTNGMRNLFGQGVLTVNVEVPGLSWRSGLGLATPDADGVI